MYKIINSHLLEKRFIIKNVYFYNNDITYVLSPCTPCRCRTNHDYCKSFSSSENPQHYFNHLSQEIKNILVNYDAIVKISFDTFLSELPKNILIKYGQRLILFRNESSKIEDKDEIKEIDINLLTEELCSIIKSYKFYIELLLKEDCFSFSCSTNDIKKEVRIFVSAIALLLTNCQDPIIFIKPIQIFFEDRKCNGKVYKCIGEIFEEMFNI